LIRPVAVCAKAPFQFEAVRQLSTRRSAHEGLVCGLKADVKEIRSILFSPADPSATFGFAGGSLVTAQLAIKRMPQWGARPSGKSELIADRPAKHPGGCL
jgi:hypothetical protein